MYKTMCRCRMDASNTAGRTVRNLDVYKRQGYKIDVRDTTGAGDSFIGAFLYCLLNDEVEDLESVSDDTLRNYLDFANAYAANTTTKEGALAAMADRAEMDEWMKTLKK